MANGVIRGTTLRQKRQGLLVVLEGGEMIKFDTEDFMSKAWTEMESEPTITVTDAVRLANAKLRAECHVSETPTRERLRQMRLKCKRMHKRIEELEKSVETWQDRASINGKIAMECQQKIEDRDAWAKEDE
jgi:hypothetical protein